MSPTERHLYDIDAETGGRHPKEVADRIKDAPLFAGMDSAEFAEIIGAFDEQSFGGGHRITLEGFRGSDFYVIVAGRARVTVEGWKVAGLGPGDFFGEIAVLGDGPRTATVAAETPLRCLVLSNGRLEELLVAHPQLGVNLLREVVGRVQAMTGRRQAPAAEVASG